MCGYWAGGTTHAVFVSYQEGALDLETHTTAEFKAALQTERKHDANRCTDGGGGG